MGAVPIDVDACGRCQRRPCTCPREFENFILGEGWQRERLRGECCMHLDDEGSFDCDRALEFFRGGTDGACEEHAEGMGAIVRKPPRITPAEAMALAEAGGVCACHFVQPCPASSTTPKEGT